MSLDLPGFADPVAQSQACFRAVLEAISHPGRIQRTGASLSAPWPLHVATAAVLLTLCDADTPLSLDPLARPAKDWLAFHGGAPLAARADAAFALDLGWMGLGGLLTGTDEMPEAGATLILQVAELGAGPALRLSGPGLLAPASLRVTGLPERFSAEWAANSGLFPRGVDLILCAGDALAVLPRTTRVGDA